MKALHLIPILLLSFALPLLGAESSTSFSKGNEALASSDYQAAIDAYENQLKESAPTAALFFNLGNAHYRLGDYGPAILAYEKALVLDPHAEDIRANLRMARDRATAFEEHSVPFWMSPFFWLSLEEWALAGMIALVVLAIVSVARGLAGEKFSRAPQRLLVVSSLTLLLLAITAVASRHEELDRGIVLKSGAKVRLSPFATADVVATLPAGRTIQIESEHDGFYKIENGWIADGDAEPVYALTGSGD
ncbi:MAG: tetratricopeptide repeat protein [Verrucomicrobiae bacterium]|nr:tetratricopeptide repeat protein [Verrucomicrobiae bacterium]